MNRTKIDRSFSTVERKRSGERVSGSYRSWRIKKKKKKRRKEIEIIFNATDLLTLASIRISVSLSLSLGEDPSIFHA